MKKGKFFCRYNYFGLSVVPKRMIFHEVKKDSVEEREGAKAAPKPSPDAVDETDVELVALKAKLQGKIDEGLNSENSEVKSAAQKANEELKATESKNLEPQQIEGYLNKMNRILRFGRINKKAENYKTTIKQFLESRKAEIKQEFKAMLNAIMEKHPDLSDEIQARLSTSNANYTQRLIQAYDNEYKEGPNTTISLDNYLNEFGNFARTMASLQNTAKDIDNGTASTSEDNEIFGKYNAELETVVALETEINVSKDLKESEAHINEEAAALLGPLQAQIIGINSQIAAAEEVDKLDLMVVREAVVNRMSDVSMIQKKALAMLTMFNKPEDAQKRAMILANFKDEIGKTFDPGFEPKYLDAATSSGGTEKDASAKAFERKPTIVTDNQEVNDAEGKTLKVNETAKFRMEANGVTLTTLTPGTKVKIVDNQVYYIVTDEGIEVGYVKVQLNPPNGPIGLVPQNNVEFKEPEEVKPIYMEATLGVPEEEPKKEKPLKIIEKDKERVRKMEINTSIPVFPGGEIIYITKLGPDYFEISDEKSTTTVGVNLNNIFSEAIKFAEKEREKKRGA